MAFPHHHLHELQTFKNGPFFSTHLVQCTQMDRRGRHRSHNCTERLTVSHTGGICAMKDRLQEQTEVHEQCTWPVLSKVDDFATFKKVEVNAKKSTF